MSGDAIVTLGVLVVVFGLLVRDRHPPTGILLAGLVALVLLDVVEPDRAFAGFANQAPLTIAALYVVAGGARRTGLLTGITAHVLGGGGRASLARLCLPTAALSGLVNNTPLVAMLVPEVEAWARRRKLPVSRYLMPLSFATILGGATTLVGSSTSLVVSGVLASQGRAPLGLFEQTRIGLPVAAVGLAVLIVIASRWLPHRGDPAGEAVAGLREYALHLLVEANGPLVGRSVADAGLRSLSGVFLADVVRGDRHIGPVGPDEELWADDLLIFVGDLGDVLDLRSRPGLRAPDEQASVLDRARHASYFEAVIGRESPLVSRTLREIGGRQGYRAAAVAIHRGGVRLGGKLGEIELQAGDTLVLLADGDLRSSREAIQDFLVVAPVVDTVAVIGRGARWVVVALAAFVALAASGSVSVLEAALVAAGIVVGSRVLTFTEAKRSVNLDVVVMVAVALGIGGAVEISGLAADIASLLVRGLGGFGPAGVVVATLLTAAVLTEIVTNAAAAALVVPIAVRTAEAVDIDVRVMAIGVAITASCSFLTPIGYQTNAMVYGPGGYRFGDYLRVGGLVEVAAFATTATLVLVIG